MLSIRPPGHGSVAIPKLLQRVLGSRVRGEALAGLKSGSLSTLT